MLKVETRIRYQNDRKDQTSSIGKKKRNTVHGGRLRFEEEIDSEISINIRGGEFG